MTAVCWERNWITISYVMKPVPIFKVVNKTKNSRAMNRGNNWIETGTNIATRVYSIIVKGHQKRTEWIIEMFGMFGLLR